MVKINKPFIGHHDWNGAFWGTITKNYIYHIHTAIPLLGVQHEVPYIHNQFIYFAHYTPLLPIFFTITSLFLGVNELSLRLTTVFFSIVMLLYLYKIACLLYDKKIALFSIIFATATPMFLYFGKLPDHEPVITSLITISYYYYLKLESYNKKTYLIFLAFLSLVLLESWAGFIYLITLVFFGIFVQKKKLGFFIPTIGIGLSVILLHLFFLYSFYGPEAISSFITSGVGRISANANTGYVVKYRALQFLNTEGHYFVIYFTRILAILTLIWVVGIFVSAKKKRINASDLKLLPLAIFAMIFILVFNDLAFIHDYKLYLFLPFISIASAQIIVKILTKILKRKRSNKVNLVVLYTISVLIIIGVFTERIQFLNTLLYTSFNQPGYDLGKYLNSITSPNDQVLIDSRQFHSFFDVFEEYYSNRGLTGSDISLDEFKRNFSSASNYRFIVLIDGRTTDKSLQDYLDQNYEVYRQKGFTAYDLSKKR